MNIAKKIWFLNPGGVSYDAASLAFFTAASITDATQKTAVNNLVVGLKSAALGNLWDNAFTGMPIHPIVGGSAGGHAVNLRNPGTNDIVWAGGITHSSTGALPNGTTGFGTDGFIPSVGQTLNNCGFSYYSGTNNLTSAFDMGTNNVGSYIGLLFGGITPNLFIVGVTVSGGASRTDGFFTAVNVAASLDISYRNGVEIARTSGVGSIGLPTIAQYYMALNNGGAAAFFSNREMRFGCKHTGLTATQAANLYTLVQAFQTTLGRNV